MDVACLRVFLTRIPVTHDKESGRFLLNRVRIRWDPATGTRITEVFLAVKYMRRYRDLGAGSNYAKI